MRNVVSPCGYARQLIGLPEQGSSEPSVMERSISRWDCFVFRFYFCWFRMEFQKKSSCGSFILMLCVYVCLKEPLGIANGTQKYGSCGTPKVT